MVFGMEFQDLAWAVEFVHQNISVVDPDVDAVDKSFLERIIFDEFLDRIEVILTEEEMLQVSKMKNSVQIDKYLQNNSSYKMVMEDLVTDILTDYLLEE